MAVTLLGTILVFGSATIGNNVDNAVVYVCYYLSNRPVRCSRSRAEESRFHHGASQRSLCPAKCWILIGDMELRIFFLHGCVSHVHFCTDGARMNAKAWQL